MAILIYLFATLMFKEAYCREDENWKTLNLQELVENLVAENKVIISQLKVQTDRIANLETTVADLTTKLLESDQKVEACLTTMSQLTAKQFERENGSQDGTDDGNELAAVVESSNSRFKNVQNTDIHLLDEGNTDAPDPTQNARRKRLMGETEVAFSAGVSTQTESLGSGQIIRFDKVLVFVDSTNSPSTYSTSTGVFTAPVSGVYVFSTTILGTPESSGHFYFHKNNTPVSILNIHGTYSHTWDSASQTIILLLGRGDNVTLRNGENGHVIEGLMHSIFSGFLLYEHESPVGVIG